MKKYGIIILATALQAVYCMAQYNVSTEVLPKNVLIEEFTGINCGNCPSAHKIIANLQLAQESNIYAIAIHSGYFASPATDEPDFRTDEGEELDTHFAAYNVGYPCGMINRHVYAGSSPVMSRSNWTLSARETVAEDAPVNLYVSAVYDAPTGVLTVDVEGYYTATVDARWNMLSVVLLQNNVQGPQSGGGVGDEYMHQHMLRDYLTPLWGDTIATCTAGTYFKKQYVYNIPSSYKKVDTNPAEMEVVAFVASDKTDVLNVAGTHLACVGLDLPLAGEIATYRLAPSGTYGFNFYELYLTNKANEPLTSATFDISLNGVTYRSEWTGHIEPLSKAYIKVPFDQEALLKSSNDYSIKLAGLNGVAYDGNTVTGYFQDPVESTPTTLIEIRTDRYALDNEWCIKDVDGNVVTTFGPYAEDLQQVYSETASLAPDKTYCFEVTDAWANGVMTPRGYAKLYDDSHSLVAQQLEIDGHGYRAFFKTTAPAGLGKLSQQNAFDVTYNRTARTISIAPGTACNYEVELYNTVGALVYRGKNAVNIPVATRGAYIVRIDAGGNSQITKIVTL